MTCGYKRTWSPVMALPMIIRWISDVPSKIVKLVECTQFPQVDALGRRLVSTSSAPQADGIAPTAPAGPAMRCAAGEPIAGLA
jgi:hypothetical protein